MQSPAIEAVYNSRIPAGDGFKVSGNIFFSLSRPAFVAKVGPLKNWEVSDNLFVTANEFAIYLRGLTDSNVEGNTVISPAPVVKGGISVIDYKADVPVVNTTAKDNSADKFDFDSGVSESNNSINSSSITDSLSAAGLSQELLDALAELISS